MLIPLCHIFVGTDTAGTTTEDSYHLALPVDMSWLYITCHVLQTLKDTCEDMIGRPTPMTPSAFTAAARSVVI